MVKGANWSIPYQSNHLLIYSVGSKTQIDCNFGSWQLHTLQSFTDLCDDVVTECTRMLSINYSPGKGVGVFARKRIPRGMVVTTYPNEPANDSDSPEYVLYLDFEKNMKVKGKPWGGAVPSRVPLSLPVGHLINDGAMLQKRDYWPGLKTYAADTDTYTRESKQASNIVQDGLVFRASRNITKGEEILFCYGPMYWTHRWYSGIIYNTIYDMMASCDDELQTDGAILSKLPGYGAERFEMLLRIGLASLLTTPMLVRGMPEFPGRERYLEIEARLAAIMIDGGTAKDIEEFRPCLEFHDHISKNVVAKFPVLPQEVRDRMANAMRNRAST